VRCEEYDTNRVCITPSWELLGKDGFLGVCETGMARIQREWWSCMQVSTPIEVVDGGHKVVNDAVQAPHQCCLRVSLHHKRMSDG